jgi:hypothetical protein
MFNFRQKTNSITTFADLKPGDIFREPNSSANFYYIKTCATDAANLITGYCFYWKPDDKVVAVTGTATNILKNDFNTTFADIGYGETFTTDSLNFNGYYMKVCAKNVSAINLLTGRSCDFESYQPIKTVQIFYED